MQLIRKLVEVQYMIREIEGEVDEEICLRIEQQVRGKSDKEIKEYVESIHLWIIVSNFTN